MHPDLPGVSDAGAERKASAAPLDADAKELLALEVAAGARRRLLGWAKWTFGAVAALLTLLGIGTAIDITKRMDAISEGLDERITKALDAELQAKASDVEQLRQQIIRDYSKALGDLGAESRLALQELETDAARARSALNEEYGDHSRRIQSESAEMLTTLKQEVDRIQEQSSDQINVLATGFEQRLGALQSQAEARSADFHRIIGVSLENIRRGADRELTLSIDISDRVGPIRDQGREGTTVGFALAYALAAEVTASTGVTPVFSARSIYVEARRRDEWAGEEYEGTSLEGGLKALKDVGAYLETDWPYDRLTGPLTSGPRQRISGFTLLPEGHTELIMAALKDEKPVTVGITVSRAFFDVGTEGKVQVEENPAPAGTHAVCIVGYNGERDEFKFANSWGSEWGASGFGYLTRNDLERVLVYAATMTL